MTEKEERVVRDPDMHIDSDAQKSTVKEDKNPPSVKQTFREGDDVKLPVVEEDISRAKKKKVKHMEIVKAVLRDGKWWYQVKISSEGPELHKDEKGNDWFDQDLLEWWP